MRLRLVLLALLPAALGVAATVIVNGTGWFDPAPIYYLRADIGTLLFLTGIGISLCLGAGVLLWSRWERNHREQRR